jgi:uncharacterized membrane protein (UPF0127 family)
MILAALAVSLALNASAAAPAAPADDCRPQTVSKKAKLTFPDHKTITVDVVDTPATRETGLMCRTKLKRDYGMLFAFPADMDLNFWMKKTLVSLDIIWISSDKKVTVIHDKLKASKADTPDDKVVTARGTGMFVLELPAGAAARHKLKAGDALDFTVAVPPL